jgi:hypothetical protein
MLYLKRLDLFIQLLLPVFGTLIALFSNFWIGFYVGATGIAFSQIMSLFLHLPAKKEFWYLKFPRKTYSYILLFQICLEISGLTVFFLSEQGNPIEQFFIISCSVLGSLLTISYWIICFLEIRKIIKKKLPYSI